MMVHSGQFGGGGFAKTKVLTFDNHKIFLGVNQKPKFSHIKFHLGKLQNLLPPQTSNVLFTLLVYYLRTSNTAAQLIQLTVVTQTNS